MKIKQIFNKYSIQILTGIAIVGLSSTSFVWIGEYEPPKELLNNNSNN